MYSIDNAWIVLVMVAPLVGYLAYKGELFKNW
jgi:hypothetical protein